MQATILITGAGPAGVLAGVGLHKLGYNVQIVSRPRRFAAIEGVSARVLQALEQQGFTHALAAVDPPGQRMVRWNGEQHAQNQEWLVDRRRFDAALWEDAKATGVPVLEAGVLRVTAEEQGWQALLDNGQLLRADFWIEARGRSAPSGQNVRGPETLSILNRWALPASSSATAIYSHTPGWVWTARLASGWGYWQYTLDGQSDAMPSKQELAAFCSEQHQQCVALQSLFPEGVPDDFDIHVRAGTSILNKAICGPNWLRVGDAAAAVDSLSGNGIFLALSSALQAPAVVNTLLKRPDDAQLALRFHEQRISHLFYRFARMGREFYSEETRFNAAPFWQERQQWPDLQDSHSNDTTEAKLCQRSVIDAHYIVEREVVVTADQPLGVWHIDGVALAPLIRRRMNNEPWQHILAEYPPQTRVRIATWLQELTLPGVQ